MSIKLNGTELSAKLYEELKPRVERIREAGKLKKVAIIQVATLQQSNTYIGIKITKLDMMGIEYVNINLPYTISTRALVTHISRLGANDDICGIIVQRPLPKHISQVRIDRAIPKSKDIDGANPINVGLLSIGELCLRPCTPAGIISLLDAYEIDIEDKNIVIFGRSNTVGKPLAMMLLNRNANVTVLHSKSSLDKIKSAVYSADIVVSCMGNTSHGYEDILQYHNNITAIVDCGTNRDENNKLIGDLNLNLLSDNYDYYTPAVGGVGPMTVYHLIENAVTAMELAW